MKVIYYTSSVESLHQNFIAELKGQEAGFSYDSSYASIICQAKNVQPDVLIFDYKEYKLNPHLMNIFGETSLFYVPLVIVAGDLYSDIHLSAPSNYLYMPYAAITKSFDTIKKKAYIVKDHLKYFENKIDTVQIAQQTLLDLGFNISTFGTIFLKDCIVAVMAQNCCPSQLTKTIYRQISEMHHTTLASVMRCTRVSLETSWKKNKRKQARLETGVSFNDFSLCPSVKEFIYYVANKLSNFIQNQKFRSL